jgi:glycosyl hydrolase family 42 (putative beta-galactosidase)
VTRAAPGQLASAAFVLVATLAAAQPAVRNDIVYSRAVVTPHVPWAATLPGGPIRGFFIPTVSRGREMVELMQRLALDPTTVTIDPQWDVNCWGLGDFYGHPERGDRDDFRIVYGYAEDELTSAKPFEVMVLPGLNGWSRLTRKTRDAILRRVQEGAGLVLVHPFVGDVVGHPFAGDEPRPDARIWELSPLVGVADDRVNERGYPVPNAEAMGEGRWEVAGEHFITDGLDPALLPTEGRGGRFYKYEARGNVLLRAAGHPILAVKDYGRGRVVAFAHAGEGFLPDPVDSVATRTYWDYWEYQYSLLARSVLWAARRSSDLRLASVSASESDGIALQVSAAAARDVEIEVRVKTDFGLPLGMHRFRRALGAGHSAVAIAASELRPAGGWPGGRAILDVIIRDASGATLDWGAPSFVVAKAAAVAALRPNATVYRVGDMVSLVTQAAGRLDGLKMRVTWSDDLDRVLAVEEKPTAGEKYFFHRLDGFIGKRLRIAAELVDSGNRVLDHLRHAPLVVVPRARRQKEYKGLLSFEDPPEPLASLRQRMLRAQAMDSGFTWGGEVTDSLEIPRGTFGTYWYDRGPTTPEGMEKAIADFQRTGDFEALQYLTRKELYRRTGEKRFLSRNPSLDDPRVLDRIAGIASSAARNKAVYNMDYYFVGDEGSLTSYGDPVDYSWDEDTIAGFRAWLRTVYVSLDALNREWRTRFAAWDDVLPATTEEARASRRFPAWADHRTYMERSFAHAYQVVRDAVVAADPEGRIALSGTQATTPYNGSDWYRLDQVVDDFLSYSGGNQWDFHRSFAKPGARIGFWTGYGRRGVGVQHEIWSAALNGVLYPNLFWSPSVINPDLTFSKSGRDMGAAFRSLRFEGVGRLLMESERVGDGIAIHYSMPSVHAAGILGLHSSAKGDDEDGGPGFPANRDGWTRMLTDLGLSYEFLAAPQIEAGGLDARGLKVVVLPLSMAVSPAEAQAIERFVRAGGVVVADGAPGILDEHLAWQPGGLLDSVFGIAAPSSETRRLDGRVAGAVSVTEAGKRWGLDPGGLAGIDAFEGGLRAQGAEALATIAGDPAVFVRQVGKGWAVYLNVLFDRYPQLRSKAYGGAAWRALASAILAHAGVGPAVTVRDAGGRPLPQTRIARYRFGGADVVALLQESLDVATLYGRDGVTVYEDARLGPVARQEVLIHLPRVARVTDVRTGKDLGRTDAVKMVVTPGDAVILAQGDAPARLTVDGPRSARRGERVSFAIGTGGSGTHLLRCHVMAPDGRFLPEYAANVLAEGESGRFEVATARSDVPGRYRIEVADVITGAAASVEVEIE